MNETGVEMLICLASAHLLADFLFQTDEDDKNKRQPRVLLKHTATVAALSYVFCGLWQLWQIPAFVLVVHVGFDRLKENLLHRKPEQLKDKPLPVRWNVYPFLTDQALHLLSLGFLAWWVSTCLLGSGIEPMWVALFGHGFLAVLVLVAGVTLTVIVGGILIGMLVAPFLRELEEAKPEDRDKLSPEERGLTNGGNPTTMQCNQRTQDREFRFVPGAAAASKSHSAIQADRPWMSNLLSSLWSSLR